MEKSKTNKRITIIMIAIVTCILYTVSTFLIITFLKNDNVENGSNTNTVDRSEQVLSSENNDNNSSDIMSTNSGSVSWNNDSGSSTETTGSNSSQSSSSELGSSTVSPSNTSSNTSTTSSSNTSSNPTVPSEKSFTSAMWFSFGEDMNFKNLTENQVKAKIDKMFDNAVNLGNDAVICQIRPFADAYYKSNLFPWSSYITGTQGKNPGYDPMAYMIEAAHKRNLEFHAWLNPYRISASTNNPNNLSADHIAKKWWNDTNKKRNILIFGNGIYFNPTKPECQKLIIDGVKEILDNYDVDGIHIDDYFYPTDNAEFDKFEYDQYKLTTSVPLSQGDWRRQHVSALVQGIWQEVHKHSGVTFGISPSYHISNNGTDDNYTKKFADLKKWMTTAGYIDYIAPQIYFGYNHSSADYTTVLNRWLGINRRSDVKLYIGLGAYKIGEEDTYAGQGKTEWQTETDILAKQTIDAFNKQCDGVFIFNYSTLYKNSDLAKAQLKNLKDAIKLTK